MVHNPRFAFHRKQIHIYLYKRKEEIAPSNAVWMPLLYSECAGIKTGLSSGWLRHSAGEKGLLADGQ